MSGRRSPLITGITGQDGSYLAELLLDKGYDVMGWFAAPRRSGSSGSSICATGSRCTRPISSTSAPRGRDACGEATGDLQLAAMSFVAVSWIQPTLTAEFTGVGVTRMLEAMREVCPEAPFYQAFSSEMFGKVREVPQTELTAFSPRSPYGVAKAYGHFITVNYRESYRTARDQRSSFQPRERAPRPGVRHPQDHLGRRRHQARAGREAAPRQHRRRTRLGPTRRTTWKRSG